MSIKNTSKTSLFILIISFSIIGIFSIFTYSKNHSEIKELKTQNIKYQQIIDSSYFVYAIPMPLEITFAGKKIPLENYDVREAIDKELHKVTYWQSEMLLYIKRRNRFFPIIEPILKKNNIPDDFKYLCVAESGMENVVSPVKAAGFWQFMKATGREYGLEINKEVDERYNLEKATNAACKYLNNSYRKYKNWEIVAAAYNMGETNVDKQLRNQKVDSYFDMYLNKETRRYVYRILAIKTVLENPKSYGFVYRKMDLYPEIQAKKVKVDSSISDMANFAKKHNTNYKILRLLNPWIRAYKLTNTKKKTYTFIIPEKNARSKKYFQTDDDSDLIKPTCNDE